MSADTRIGALAAPTAPVVSGSKASEIFQRFDQAPGTLLLAVVDPDGRPLGVIDRNQFASPAILNHARRAYADWPVDDLMNPTPLIAGADDLITDFIANVMTDHQATLPSGLVVVVEGRYAGICDIGSLFRVAMDERSATASEMFDLIQTLQAAHVDAEANRKFNTTVIEHIPAVVWVKDARTNRFIMLNRAGEALLGVPREAFIGQTSDEFFSPEMAGDPLAGESQLMAGGGLIEFDAVPYVRRSDWDERFLKLKKIAIPDAEGQTEFILGVGEDVTERHRIEMRFERLARFDPMTNLPNKPSFIADLGERLAIDQASHQQTCILVVGLDGVRAVNDTLGHMVGEDLLYHLAGRLRECAGKDGSVARLGGDEFVILAGPLSGRKAMDSLARRVIAAIKKPFVLQGQMAVVAARVGIATAPDQATEATDLLKKAEIALHGVKPGDVIAHRIFTPGMDEHAQERRVLELDMRAAIKAGDFEAHFQPQYDIGHRRISGFETLVRWHHPTRGWVSPADFVPLAEEIGLVSHLGEQMLHQACCAAASWPGHISVAVNVSPIQLKKRGFTAVVAQCLAMSGLAPERLELEITESVLVDEDQTIITQLNQIRSLGVRLSLDDFGTGYTSLAYLSRLPVSKIKIDQSFVKRLPAGEDSIAIIGAITEMARKLGMSTTAEGVENQAQLDAVTRLGCTHVQGYLIGRATANPSSQLFQAA